MCTWGNIALMKRIQLRTTSVTLLFFLAISCMGFVALPAHAAPACSPAGGTGLTAAVIATSGQKISSTINASGCDIGIYVGPGTSGVVINGAKVTGANDHGIFVQDASNIVIKNNVVSGNGIAPNTAIQENKAIELVGTSHSTVSGNVVRDNLADGGIGVADDGPAIDPGAPVASATSPLPGNGNVVTNNYVKDNAAGCGIVVAAYNEGGGVSHNVVSDNRVVGGWSGAPGTSIPYVGGIVVAADSPSTNVAHNTVSMNTIVVSLIPGIVVHSNAPGDYVSGTILYKNYITKNGAEGPPDDPSDPTGIEIVAESAPGMPNAPVLVNTYVISQTIHQDVNGIWLCFSTGTHISGLTTHAVTNPVIACPSGGS